MIVLWESTGFLIHFFVQVLILVYCTKDTLYKSWHIVCMIPTWFAQFLVCIHSTYIIPCTSPGKEYTLPCSSPSTLCAQYLIITLYSYCYTECTITCTCPGTFYARSIVYHSRYVVRTAHWTIPGSLYAWCLIVHDEYVTMYHFWFTVWTITCTIYCAMYTVFYIRNGQLCKRLFRWTGSCTHLSNNMKHWMRGFKKIAVNAL